MVNQKKLALLLILTCCTNVRTQDRSSSHTLYEQRIEQTALTPLDDAGWNKLGVLYCDLNRYDEAVKAFHEALKFNPLEPRLTANLGAAYYFIGRYDDAVDLLEDAVRRDPNLYVAQNNLGQIYLKISRYKEAVKHLKQARQLGQDNDAGNDPDLSNNLGFAYARLKRYREATTYLTEAIALKPDFAIAIFNLGLVRLILNDRSAALEQYAALKTLDQKLADKLLSDIYRGRVLTATTER